MIPVPFSRFALRPAVEREGFQLDCFLGIVVRREFRLESASGTFGEPKYPPQDDEYREWVDLLESVLESKNEYVMIELGAGFGRWAVRGAFAAAQIGVPYQVICVEADPVHFQWLWQHFEDNDVTGRLIPAAISDSAGQASFSKHDNPAASYGQSILRNRPDIPTFPVPTITLPSLLIDYPLVDLIDLDVQGEEALIVSASIAELNAKVKRLHIATHTLGIEGELRECLGSNGWVCLADESVRNVDGVQSWINPHRI